MNFASAVSSLDETYRKQIHYLIVMTEILAFFAVLQFSIIIIGTLIRLGYLTPRICPFFFWGGGTRLKRWYRFSRSKVAS